MPKKVEHDTPTFRVEYLHRNSIVSIEDPVYLLLTSLKQLARHSTFPTLLLGSLGRPPLAVLNDREKSSLLLNSSGFFCGARKSRTRCIDHF